MFGIRQYIGRRLLRLPSQLKPAMSADVVVNGTKLRLARPSDFGVAQCVAANLQRRIAEDDWCPYRSRSDAVRAWMRLGVSAFR
jgi:hypothetical protein